MAEVQENTSEAKDRLCLWLGRGDFRESKTAMAACFLNSMFKWLHGYYHYIEILELGAVERVKLERLE